MPSKKSVESEDHHGSESENDELMDVEFVRGDSVKLKANKVRVSHCKFFTMIFQF